MNSPTPPTKPIPPTPPTINGTSSRNSTDVQSPVSTTQNSASPSKPDVSAMGKKAEGLIKAFQNPTTQLSNDKSATAETAISPSTDSKSAPIVPYLGTYEETTSKTTSPPTAPISKDKPISLGVEVYFALIAIVSVVGFLAFLGWKNFKPKQRTVVDYSADSKELINLITSQTSYDSATQPIPKSEAKPKIKSNFEFRV